MTIRYFDTPAPPVEHPRIRAWTSYCRRGEFDRMEVDITRARMGFGFGPPSLHVAFLDEQGEHLHDAEAPWELVLDEWLLARGARARAEDAEVLRTMVRFRERVDALLHRYGEGYFNGLVVTAIKRGDLNGAPPVAEKLAKITEYRPHDGGSLDRNLAEVDAILAGVARELIDALGYPRDAAERIFTHAIALYLDERFHITERLRLFGR